MRPQRRPHNRRRARKRQTENLRAKRRNRAGGLDKSPATVNILNQQLAGGAGRPLGFRRETRKTQEKSV